jgi:hypothetical protein
LSLITVIFISLFWYVWNYKASLIDRVLFASISYDLKCDQIISSDEATRIFEANIQEIDELRTKFAGYVFITLADAENSKFEKCPGKTDLLIEVTGEAETKYIQKQFGGTFHGIPYRIINR